MKKYSIEPVCSQCKGHGSFIEAIILHHDIGIQRYATECEKCEGTGYLEIADPTYTHRIADTTRKDLETIGIFIDR
jgi:DnaJ-class molecular chaperone